ncbi:MAG: hypothetical protein WD042_09095 [Phycisphaeraceae bacterium]
MSNDNHSRHVTSIGPPCRAAFLAAAVAASVAVMSLGPRAEAAIDAGTFLLQGWFDEDSWSPMQVPTDADDVFIAANSGIHLNLDAPEPTPAAAEALSLNIGFKTDTISNNGTLTGTGGINLAVGGALNVGGGTATTANSQGDGTLTLTDTAVTTDKLFVASATANGAGLEARGTAHVTFIGDSTLDVGGFVRMFTADGLGDGSTAESGGIWSSSGTVTIGSSLMIAGAQAVENANSLVNNVTFTHNAAMPGDDFSAGTVIVGGATSFGGTAIVQNVDVFLAADEFTYEFYGVANGTVSTFTAATPMVVVNNIAFTAEGNTATTGPMRIANVDNANFDTGGGEVEVFDIQAVWNVRGLAVNDQVQIGSVFGGNGGTSSTIDTVTATFTNSDTTVAGPTDVGTVTVGNGEAASVKEITVTISSGSYLATGSVADLNIAIVQVTSGTAGVVQTQASVNVIDADVNLDGVVNIGDFHAFQAAGGSFAQGELNLVNSRLTADAVNVGTNVGKGLWSGNPSYAGITGDVVLGDGATLRFGIHGLARSSAALLADYAAIDAANATLAGLLELAFDFPGVTLGDTFELIRLDEGGAFIDDFADITTTGLPGGWSVEAFKLEGSYYVTVIPEPATAALMVLVTAIACRRRRGCR